MAEGSNGQSCLSFRRHRSFMHWIIGTENERSEQKCFAEVECVSTEKDYKN